MLIVFLLALSKNVYAVGASAKPRESTAGIRIKVIDVDVHLKKVRNSRKLVITRELQKVTRKRLRRPPNMLRLGVIWDIPTENKDILIRQYFLTKRSLTLTLI
jgi:hypothetical protein